METAIWLRKRDMLKDHFLQCPLEGGGGTCEGIIFRLNSTLVNKKCQTRGSHGGHLRWCLEARNTSPGWAGGWPSVPGGLFDPPADAEEAKLILEAQRPPRDLEKPMGLFSTSKKKNILRSCNWNPRSGPWRWRHHKCLFFLEGV